MAIPPAVGGPIGYGYASVTNTAAGSVTFAGALADGTAISITEPYSEGGYVPLYAMPYANNGLLIGWIDFTGGVPSGQVTWIDPGGATTINSAGFTNALVDIVGSAYVPSSGLELAGTTVLHSISYPSGTLTITDSELTGSPYVFNVAVSNNTLVKLTGSATNTMTGTIAPATGVMTISFKPANSSTSKTATGIVVQGSQEAVGEFIGTANDGEIDLQ